MIVVGYWCYECGVKNRKEKKRKEKKNKYTKFITQKFSDSKAFLEGRSVMTSIYILFFLYLFLLFSNYMILDPVLI